MSEDDRHILEKCAEEGCAPAATLFQAVRILSKLALDAQQINIDRARFFHLGAEADGFITIHPKL